MRKRDKQIERPTPAERAARTTARVEALKTRARKQMVLWFLDSPLPNGKTLRGSTFGDECAKMMLALIAAEGKPKELVRKKISEESIERRSMRYIKRLPEKIPADFRLTHNQVYP